MKLQPRASFGSIAAIILFVGFAAFAMYDFWPSNNRSLLFKYLLGVFVLTAIAVITFIGSREYIFFAPDTRKVFRFEEMLLPTTLHFSHLPNLREYALLIICEPIYQKKPNAMRSFRLGKLLAHPPTLKYSVKLLGHRNGETTSLPGKTFDHVESDGDNGDYEPKRKEEILIIPPGFDEYSMEFNVEVAQQRLSSKQLQDGTPENEALKEAFTLEISFMTALNLRQAFGHQTLIDLSQVEAVKA